MSKIFSLLFLLASPLASAPLPEYGSAGSFAFIDQDGKLFTEKNLAGRFWIMDFIFTRCSGPCPLLTRNMAALQKTLPEDVGLISITVDPDHDDPLVLYAYSKENGAQSGRWYFLSGSKEKIYPFIRGKMLNAVEPNPSAADAGEGFIHSQKFVLLDEHGMIRGFFDGEDPAVGGKIKRALKGGKPEPWEPRVNALLNASSAFFLLAGYFFIRRGRIRAHLFSMGLAFLISGAFLVNYLIYHFRAGSTTFTGEGLMRVIYFSILISHSILAVAVVPLVLITIFRAIVTDYEGHQKIARWTLPIWLYVSVTGVVVYRMLYRI